MATSTAAFTASSYLRWFLGSAVAATALVGALNVAVDPLDVFATPRFAGFNALKPHLDHHRELTRWSQAQRVCPSAVILGNSRAEIGFNPEHPGFAALGLSAVNQAVPGTDASRAYRQLLWLQSIGCMPRVIVLGAEFFDFLGGAPAKPLPTLASAPPPLPDAAFFAEAVFSLSGLGDAFTTLGLQWMRYPATLTERGFNPLLNYAPEVAQSGHYALFRQRALENARNWSRKAPRLNPEDGGESEDQRAVRAILALATAAGSSVHVVIYPYHAQIRMMLERVDLGELFKQWKQNLVTMVDATPGAAGNISLWDFSGIAPQTLEAIPAPQDRLTQLRGYWECGHFKQALGGEVLSRVLGQAAQGLGTKLNAANAADWLTQDRAAVQALLVAPSALRDEVDDVVLRTRALNAR